MARRLYRTVALAVAGTLSLLSAPLAQSGAATPVIEENTPARTAVNNRKPLNKQIEGRTGKQDRPQISEFVALGSLLLDNAFLPDSAGDSHINAFNPAVIDRIVSSDAKEWASGHGNRGYDGHPFKSLFNTSPRPPGNITIQPLAIRKVSPAFASFVTTMLPHPIVFSTGERYVSGSIPHFEINSSFNTVYDSRELQGVGPNSTVKNDKSPFSYSYKKDKVALNTGISWINDLADSRGVYQTFQKAGYEIESTADKVHGVNFNLGASYQAFSLTGGYIRALDRYAPAQPSFTGNETESGAWSSEIAYTTELLRKETVLAVGYQKSSESLKLYLPEQRYVTRASMSIFDGTTLSLEYYRDKDNFMENGGVNGDGYGVTTKIGFEFQVDR